MWLIALSLSQHNLHLLFYSVLTILPSTKSLWRCLMQQLEKVRFFSYGFPFLVMSKFFPVRFRLFVTRNVYTVVFLPVFVFPYFWVLSKEVSCTIFLSLWHDSTWDWTLVSWTIGMCMCVSERVHILYIYIIYIYIYIYIYKVKLATVVEGDQKAPFSIATTPRCKRGRYSFSRIAPL